MWSLALLPCKCLVQGYLIQFWDSKKKKHSQNHVFCNIILSLKHFHLPAEGNKLLSTCARWKTVISANEIQWIRLLKRCSEQDNSVWLISDFDSEIFRKTSAPLFLQGEKAIHSPSLSSPISDTAVLNNNYICRILRETFLSLLLFLCDCSFHTLWWKIYFNFWYESSHVSRCL